MIEKKYRAKKKKLCKDLDVGKKLLILAERIRKNQSQANSMNKQFKTFQILTKKKQLP